MILIWYHLLLILIWFQIKKFWFATALLLAVIVIISLCLVAWVFCALYLVYSCYDSAGRACILLFWTLRVMLWLDQLWQKRLQQTCYSTTMYVQVRARDTEIYVEDPISSGPVSIHGLVLLIPSCIRLPHHWM